MASISLDEIAHLLTPSLYEALQHIGVESLEEAMHLDLTEFCARVGARSALHRLFAAFQRDVQLNPSVYGISPATAEPESHAERSAWRSEVHDGILRSVGHVEIELVAQLVPRRLIRLFQHLQCKRLSDVVATFDEACHHDKGWSQEEWDLIAEFLDKIVRQPNTFLRAHEKEKVHRLYRMTTYDKGCDGAITIIPATNVESMPLLLAFKEFEVAYSMCLRTSALKIHRHHMDVRSFYGIGCPRRTHTEIAAKNQVSRSCIGQRHDRQIQRLEDIVLRGRMHLKDLRCASVIPERMLQLESVMMDTELLSFAQASALVGVPLPQVQADALEGYLLLLYSVLGYSPYNYRNTHFLSRIKGFNNAKLASLLRAVYDEMYAVVRPMEAAELTEKVRHRISEVELTSKLIACVLEADPRYESVSTKGGVQYQISFLSLRSFASKAVVVLREIGEPLHFSTIMRHVNDRLRKLGASEQYDSEQASSLLLTSDLLVPLGKTGHWALAEWGMQYQTAFELIERVLTESGTPLSRQALIERIHALQPETKEDTIRSAASRWRTEIVVLGDGSYALSRWYEVEEKRAYDAESFRQAVVELFREQNVNVLKLETILEGVRQRGFDAREAAMAMRIRALPQVQRVKGEKGMYELISDSVSAGGGATQGRVLDAVFELFDASTEAVTLFDAVQHVQQKLGLSRAQVYRLLRQTTHLKRFTVGRQVFIARSEASVKNES